MATNSVQLSDNPPDTENDNQERPKNPRIPDDAVPYFKILRKLVMTHTKASHHSTFLHDCLTRRATPKGLQVKLTAQVPDPDLDFSLKWDQAHWEFSKTLTTLLANYYLARAKTTEKSIVTASSELAKRCDKETLEYIHQLNKTIETNLQLDLLKRRNQKTAGSRNTRRTTTSTRSTTEAPDNSVPTTSDS